MFRKYEKTYRIRIPQFQVPGKHYLSSDETKRLIGAKVIVEEKMDGANAGIIRHKSGLHLQKRGSLVSTSEHAQFQFFHGWSNVNYDKIMAIPVGYLIYGELMYAQHNIFYDKLPDYFLVFDIFNGKKFLSREERNEFCEILGFSQVPFISEGYFKLEDLYSLLPKISAYGDRAEGIVIKRYRKKEYMRGKIVWPEFMKTIDEHWTKKDLRKNLLGV